MKEIMVSVAQIARAPEQASARLGLQRLEEWRAGNPGAIIPYTPVTYESPGGLFKVLFTADFGIRMGADGVAVHLWNTAFPTLSPRMVYAALSLFQEPYAASGNAPDDLAVLSLREPRLYRLSEARRFAGLGASLAARIEDMMRDIADELDLPGHGDRPGQIR